VGVCVDVGVSLQFAQKGNIPNGAVAVAQACGLLLAEVEAV
jgi:hypothetical protein